MLYPLYLSPSISLPPTRGQVGLARYGGATAPWRSDQSLLAKYRLLRKMEQHIQVELRRAKKNFVGEHELFFSPFFDRCVDSAALATLVLPFSYFRLHWILVPLLELTLYAILAAVLNLYAPWQSRNAAFIAVDALFGLLTYIFNPYTEELDRWLEYVGRLLIFAVALGFIVASLLRPANLAAASTGLYSAADNSSYFSSKFLFNGRFGIYNAIDITLSLFFFSYLIYVLRIIGFFGVFQRFVNNLLLVYHDHVFDFLVDKIDQKVIGMENVFVGFRLVQQWDEIIKMQRRYAFLTWPDVRPPHLVTAAVKLMEIKWWVLPLEMPILEGIPNVK